MPMKILGAGALLMAGWFWFYLFVRQFLFNFFTAYPLIKGMQAAKDDLIAIGARRYTAVSVASCAVVCAIVVAIVLIFCPWYFILCFVAGALVALVMYIPLLGPSNRPMFDSFCATAGDGSAAMLLDIRRDKAMRRQWRKVVEERPGVVTFDLYYCGLVFFDKKRYKQNYIINF